jgi:hypothetical protein
MRFAEAHPSPRAAIAQSAVKTVPEDVVKIGTVVSKAFASSMNTPERAKKGKEGEIIRIECIDLMNLTNLRIPYTLKRA